MLIYVPLGILLRFLFNMNIPLKIQIDIFNIKNNFTKEEVYKDLNLIPDSKSIISDRDLRRKNKFKVYGIPKKRPQKGGNQMDRNKKNDSLRGNEGISKKKRE